MPPYGLLLKSSAPSTYSFSKLGVEFSDVRPFLRIINFLDTYIQKAKKTYQDTRSRRNISTLNTELHDVQRIMVQNIDDVLQRGAVLSGNTKLKSK